MAVKRSEYSSSVKDENMYEALRSDGASQEKSARITDAPANSSRSDVGHRGGESGEFEDWTADQLHYRAREIDIAVRSSTTKKELITALRNH